MHGDVKPANILLDSAGNACLADMGCAKEMLDGKDCVTVTTKGTPAFMDIDSRNQIVTSTVLDWVNRTDLGEKYMFLLMPNGYLVVDNVSLCVSLSVCYQNLLCLFPP